MRLEALLFDLDGTLANTLPLCIKVYQQSLHHYSGRSYTDAEVTAQFGVTEAGIFQRMLPDHWEEALDYYHNQYEYSHDECSEPFPGIKKALSLLKEKHVRMAIITGKGPRTARFTVDYLGLNQYFERIEAGKEDAVVKAVAMRTILRDWNIDPQYAAYIGDTDIDIKEAIAANVLPLGAKWATTSTIHLLRGIEPFARFSEVESFSEWIEQNIEQNN